MNLCLNTLDVNTITAGNCRNYWPYEGCVGINAAMSEITAKVYRSAKRVFECKLLGTDVFVQAIARPQFVKGDNHIVVGDEVEVQLTENPDDPDEYEIIGLTPRKSEIYRRLVREKKKKVIASNVDLILIVSAVSKPDYKPGLMDRYLLRAVQWDLPVVLIFNKMDEFDKQFDLDFELNKFSELNVKTFCMSAKFGKDSEFDEIKNMLNGKTAILLGQSGVGKSKIISKIADNDIDLLSNSLGKSDKGAHTTTWAEIVNCGTFDCIDSPGIRTMSIEDITNEELPSLFPDIEVHFPKCKFNDCQHEENSKGCFFQTLDDTVFEHQVILERLWSYQRMKVEVEAIPDWKR